jgi:hypothetical protein
MEEVPATHVTSRRLLRSRFERGREGVRLTQLAKIWDQLEPVQTRQALVRRVIATDPEETGHPSTGGTQIKRVKEIARERN